MFSLRNSIFLKTGFRNNSLVISRNFITKRKTIDLPQHRSGDGSSKISPYGYLLLAVPATTFGLGCWQVKRKSWKEELVKQMETKMRLPPKPLPEDLDQLQSMEYETVSVTGHFLHDKELLLGPRNLIKPGDADTGGGLMSLQNSSSGFIVITPFKLEDREETILVNRGWVSRKHRDPKTRQQGQIEGTVELLGVVRNSEPRPQFTPSSKSDPLFLYRDVPRMCEMTGADPIFLDAKYESTVNGGPIGGQTRITLRNEHFSYIVTWFSLSAATAYFWWMKIVKRTVF